MQSEGDITALCRSIHGSDEMRVTGVYERGESDEPLRERCDRICRVGRMALGVRAAAVSIYSGNRQRFEGASGWERGELSLADSLCRRIRDCGHPLIVSDLRSDPDLRSARLVTEGPRFCFYGGYPVRNAAGEPIGAFCVFDVTPRQADRRLRRTLTDLGQLVERELRSADLWDAQNQLASKLGEARRQAMLDGLTGVWNRRGGMELLRMIVQRSAATLDQFALCLIDIDHFKTINDRLGHSVGDRVLQTVAATISEAVRPNDIVMRYGGDEFILILREPGPEGVGYAVRRIRDKLKRSSIPGYCERGAPTLSIGVALTDPKEPLSAQRLIERADEALYGSKRRGRDTATVWAANQ